MTDVWSERMEHLEAERPRDPFNRDRARVIHSAFFRRLQGKTQVLGLGESDFYRTRLTHSIEVAQIANGIVAYLHTHSNPDEIKDWLPTSALIETIALAHDIGHPPFGHGGEVALNYSMRANGGFEGNAQTLRICTKLGEYSENTGLNLTRRVLLGILKYPAPYSSVVDDSLYNEKSAPCNIDSFKPPKCVFDCDSDSLDFIFTPVPEIRTEFQQTSTVKNKHKKTKYKSFDTSIMELADDIAYGVHDLEDAIALNLVTERQWNKEVLDRILDKSANHPLREDITSVTKNLFSGTNKIRKKSIGFLVGYFVNSCSVSKQETFSHNLFDLKAIMNGAASEELDILKRFVIKNVVKTAEVQTLEYKGQQMVIRLFDAISNNPSRLLPKKYYDQYLSCSRNPRVICDYLAGTTDDYATRLYHKIFTPSSGSIFDRL